MGDAEEGDEETPVQVATQQHAAKFFFSLEDLEKHADSGKPRILDKTRPNMMSWIAFRLVLWFELVDRGNMWKTLHDGLIKHSDCIQTPAQRRSGNRRRRIFHPF